MRGPGAARADPIPNRADPTPPGKWSASSSSIQRECEARDPQKRSGAGQRHHFRTLPAPLMSSPAISPRSVGSRPAAVAMVFLAVSSRTRYPGRAVQRPVRANTVVPRSSALLMCFGPPIRRRVTNPRKLFGNGVHGGGCYLASAQRHSAQGHLRRARPPGAQPCQRCFRRAETRQD